MKSKKNNKKWWLVLTIIFVFAFISFLAISNEKKESREERKIEEIKDKKEKEEEEERKEKIAFNVPLLLNKNAFQVKEILLQEYGEPISFWEPAEAMFGPSPGAMSWLNEEMGIIFSFEYWPDGSINNQTLFLGGAKEQGHTVNSVLEAGNLEQTNQNYKIEINPLNIDEMVDIWITPKNNKTLF